MLRSIFSALLAFSIVVSSTTSAFSYSSSDGTYYYRYKTAGFEKPVVVDPSSKDITAYFIGGVGDDFSEKLPLKPQWEDDNWSVTKGNLPDGISFDQRTRTFLGKPTRTVSDQVVELTGSDISGESATAEVHFAVYELPDTVVDVDYIGHTGQYSSNALKLPNGVTIDGDPKLLTATPPGITYNARYFEGTPTKASDVPYPVLAIGYNYLGVAVVAFKGKYAVADGPVFAKVGDDIRPVAANEFCVVGSECSLWINENIPAIQRSVTDLSKVRYYVETENNEPLPGSLSYSGDAFNRRLSGRVFDYYSQATVRYKAVDSDATVGYSNWFKIGSGGPVGVCKPPVGQSEITLSDTVGSGLILRGYKIPSGADSAKKSYSLVSGSLPEGIQLDETTGSFTGVPTAEGEQKNVLFRIAFPEMPGSDPVVCGPYKIAIQPAEVKLRIADAKPEYRVGDDFTAKAVASGGLVAPYELVLDSSSNLPSGISFDDKTGAFSGVLATPGTYGATVRFNNGNNVKKIQTFSFVVRDKLKIDQVAANPKIRQYDVADTLLSVSFDQNTVIGIPKLEVLGGPLPLGFTFDGFSKISGGTRLPTIPAPGYGPYAIRLSDSSGEHVDSNEFFIDVTARQDLVAGETVDPLTFGVNLTDRGQKPFDVTQPELAKGVLPLEYTLQGPALPAGLGFDEAKGVIYGTPTVKGTASNYMVTVREVGPDNFSKTSSPFSITVNDPPPIIDATLATLQGNVGGPQILSADPLPTLATAPYDYLLVGGVQSVKFAVEATPVVPGLSYDAVSGRIKGSPTTEFAGNITVSYADGAQRDGKVIVPVRIYPYPALTTEKEVYEVPRLAQAAGIVVTPANTGFYNGVNYSLAPGSDQLPTGMALSGNRIIGSTKDPVDTTRHIVIRGTSVANGLYADQPLTIKIAESEPLKLELPQNLTLGIWLNPDTGAVATRDPLDTVGYIKGSYVSPLTWALAGQPTWLTITADGVLGGKPPAVGNYVATVTITDGEGRSASGQIKLHVSLEGNVAISPGSGGTKVVRRGETFRTTAQTISKEVAPITLIPNTPLGLSFDNMTAVYEGALDQDGKKIWNLQVTDSDGRTLEGEGVQYSVEVIPPLELGSAAKNAAAKQYSATNPVNVQFRAPTNVIGLVNYAIEGDVPGKLYYKGYNSSGLVTYTYYSGTGSTEVVTQNPGDTIALTEERLSLDHLVFDPEALTLTGIPSRTGSFPIRLVAVDSHQYEYYKADSTREAYNTAKSPYETIVVGGVEALQIVSSVNPKGVVVPDGNASVVVTPQGDAYGAGVTWTVTNSTLPTGITYKTSAGAVTFSGTSTAVGTYSITLSGKDLLNRQASLVQTFKVFISTDAIILNVADIKTKPGYPAVMEPPFATAKLTTSNTFGPVRFYSYDLPNIPGTSLDANTGYIAGQFATPQSLDFDLYVTDDTDRVTSKPVVVTVIPNLRLLAPSQMSFEQSKPANQTISTDYVLGTVTYEKGAGNWPDGFTVDPLTGAISSYFVDPVTKVATTDVIAEAKTYSGLTIVGKDAFGTYVDQQSSNAFSIVVAPSTAEPDIADQARTVLGIEDTTIANWTLKPASGWSKAVVEKVSRKAWNLSGTVYSANYDLSQYGLTFDRQTGSISGTPTKPFVISDFKVTVTSQRGDSDTTAPFWIGVQPKDPITLDPNQNLNATVHKGDLTIVSSPLHWLNTVGTLTHVQISGTAMTINSADGTLIVPAGNPTSGWPVGSYVYGIKVTDEFGRTATTSVTMKVLDVFKLTTADIALAPNTTITNKELFTYANNAGSVTATVTGLPAYLTLTQPNLISGTVPASEDGKEYSISVSVKDSPSATPLSGVFKLSFKGGYIYFRIADPAPNFYPTGSIKQAGGFLNVVFKEGLVDVSSAVLPGRLTGLSLDPQPYAVSFNNNDSLQVGPDANGLYWKGYKFNRPVNITSVTVNYYTSWQAGNTNFKNPRFEASNDGVTWTTLWTQSPAWPVALANTSTKP